MMRDPSSRTLLTPWGSALSESEKAESFTNNLESSFLPVAFPIAPVVTVIIDVDLRSYFVTPSTELNLTNPEEAQEVIRVLKVCNTLEPIGIPNRALKHLPQRTVSLLVLIFNTILLTHHFP